MIKFIEDNLIGLLISIIILGFTIIGSLIIASNKYENDIAKLQRENKKLEYTNKELINSIEVLNTELNNAYDRDCGFFEDFYYEHAEEVGAYE